MALNTAKKKENKYNTYEDKPNNLEEHKIENDTEVLECKVCEQLFRNEITSKNHDRKVHWTLGPRDTVSYKCDYCKSLQPTREQLLNHITNNHTRCKTISNIKIF